MKTKQFWLVGEAIAPIAAPIDPPLGMVESKESGLQSQMNKLNDTAKTRPTVLIETTKINAQKTKTIVVSWELGYRCCY